MKRILLIEDEEGLRSMLRISLEKMGYAVVEASDGKAAMAIFKTEPVDLVLTDLMMPEKEGLETIRELRKGHPELKIIAMSGGGRTDARDNLKMAKLFGATTVFSKPFSLAELSRAVTEIFKAATPDSPDQVFVAE
jgi:DNA-binding response OmpR family regulator